MDNMIIPSITVICYLIAELFKVVILKKKTRYKYVPIIVGFIGGVLGSCDFALVNVGNHLVGTVYTFVEGGPAFQNLAVVVAETEVYQLSKVG